MATPLALVAVAGLLAGSVEPPDGGGADLTRVRWQFRPGDRWEVVRGSKGADKIPDGYVEFGPRNTVEVGWTVPLKNGNNLFLNDIYPYVLDPVTGLPSFRDERQRGTFRRVGSRLELKVSGRHRSDTLYLLLKRVKDRPPSPSPTGPP